MTAAFLHLLSFIVTALVGCIALLVIRHMVRGYWRKAWLALNGGRHVAITFMPGYQRCRNRRLAR
ncbi:MAG: hypothetical protein E2598_06330 [Sphingobium sp.]|nr:hypothetical protein [Sphingobium sp.]